MWDKLKKFWPGKWMSRKLFTFLFTLYIVPELKKQGFTDDLIQEIMRLAMGLIFGLAAQDVATAYYKVKKGGE